MEPQADRDDIVRENERLRVACQSATAILTTKRWGGHERETVMAALNVLDIAMGGPGKWQ